MQVNDIQALIESAIPDCQAEVQIDGSHIAVNAISPAFAGLNAVKKQQLVYAGLQEAIASGAIHAVHIKTYTPEEWDARQV